MQVDIPFGQSEMVFEAICEKCRGHSHKDVKKSAPDQDADPQAFPFPYDHEAGLLQLQRGHDPPYGWRQKNRDHPPGGSGA